MRDGLKSWLVYPIFAVATVALGESFIAAQPPCPPPPPNPYYCPPAPSTPGAAPYMPMPSTPGPSTAPGTPSPSVSGTSESTAPAPGMTGTADGAGMGSSSLAFAGLGAGAGVGASAALNAGPAGYIDSAIPKTMFRLRYDAGFDVNRPDRAEFFYAAWRELSFHPHGINGNGAFFDPKARGPETLPGNLDYQELSSYLEIAFNNRFSAFVDIPVRWLSFRNIQEEPDTERMPNGGFFPEPREENTEPMQTRTGGLYDIQAGFKYALLADPDRYLTFQLRGYFPTGNPSHGLSTGHTSLEPGLLYYGHPTDRLYVQAQLRDWIPIDGSRSVIDGKDFNGNVLIYGLGVGYDVYNRCNLRVTPITEVVGWTVINGLESFGGPIGSVARAREPAGLGLSAGSWCA